MSDAEAKFSIVTTSNAEELLRSNVASAKEYEKEIASLKTQTDSLAAAEKRLRGSSAEVKEARETVRSQIKALTSDMGRLALASLKAEAAEAKRAAMKPPPPPPPPPPPKAGIRASIKEGISSKLQSLVPSKVVGDGLEKLIEKGQKAWENRAEVFKSTIEKTGQKLKSAAGAAVSSTGSALSSLGSSLGTAAIGGAVGLLALAGAATVATLKMGDAERSAALYRQALTGSKEQAQALNTWEIHLADSTGLTRESINKSSAVFSKARLSNKEYTASLEATALAQASMGDQLAGKVEELTTRYARRGVFTLGRFELDGTGLQTAEVAASLAKSTNVSVAEAQRALVSGRLPLEKGAAALRDALKLKFGEVVSAKSISFEALSNRAKDRLGAFVGQIDFTPVNSALSRMLTLFDSSTVTGKTMTKVIDLMVKGIAWFVDYGVKNAIESFQGLVLVGLKVENQILRWRIQARYGGGVVGTIAEKFESVRTAIAGAGEELKRFVDIGKLAKDGVEMGIKSGAKETLGSGGAALFDAIEAGFKARAMIHSPSRAAAKTAGYVPQGMAQGLAEGVPQVKAAGDRLADAAVPSMGRDSGGAPAVGAGRSVEVNVNFYGGASKESGAINLDSPSGRAAIVRAIREAVEEGTGL